MSVVPGMVPVMGVGRDRDAAIIKLASDHYDRNREGYRTAAAFDKYGLTYWQFWAKVYELCSDPEMEALEPVRVHQLVRLMEQRRLQRTPRAS